MQRKLRAGDLIEVKQPHEILSTLDEDGSLDGLPFMPEMLPFTGRRFRVSTRAHKTCDTVHQTGARRLVNTVHLEDLRCDGSAHGGCKATCLLFWKEDWLKPVHAGTAEPSAAPARTTMQDALVEAKLTTAAVSNDEDGTAVYRCQATALFEASAPLPWWDLRQYIEDLTSGNVRFVTMLRVLFFHGLHKLMGMGVGYRLWRAAYDRLQPRFGGFRYPYKAGSIPPGEPTPAAKLDLQPGEHVRIKSHDEILETLDRQKRNRGMRFDEEMVPYCEKRFSVVRRVDRIIHERTGRMIEIQSPSVILDGVVCRSELSDCRLFCPRRIPSYWREIWLERDAPELAKDR